MEFSSSITHSTVLFVTKGECDLQDQAMGFGHAGSRYQANKRAVDEK